MTRHIFRPHVVLAVVMLASMLVVGASRPALAAPPSNDNANAAEVINGFDTRFGSNDESTGQPAEPEACVGTADTTVWYSWQAPLTTVARFSTDGSSFDTILGVYTATNPADFSTFTQVGCDDDSGAGVQSQIDLPVTAGVTYLLQVDGFNATTGDVAVTVSEAPCTTVGAASVNTGILGLYQRECDALVTLFNFTGGADWSDSTGWSAIINGGNTDPCSGWVGVTCENAQPANFAAPADSVATAGFSGALQKLVAIDLDDNNLQGRVPTAIGKLLDLETLRLADNSLSGVVPRPFVRLTELTELDLSGNGCLTADLPTKTFIGSLGQAAALGTGCDAIDDKATTTVSEQVEVDVLANDLLPIASVTSLIAEWSDSATRGTVQVVGGATGTVSYTPNPGVTGTDTFDYRACSYSFCNIATVTVRIFPQNQTFCAGEPVTIDMNTNGGDGLGTSGADVILGTPGADRISALGGDDIICGGFGADQILGGAGNDLIFGEQGPDNINAGPGTDRVFGQGGDDTLIGSDDNDVLRGGVGGDLMHGGDGNDTVFGNAGNDIANGGAGNDRLRGQANADTLRGEAGNDLIVGGGGVDVHNGGGGTDRCFEGANQNVADTYLSCEVGP